MRQPATLAELRASGYRSRSVKEEMERNLVARLRRGEEIFPGIHGYQDTVIPQILNAVLAHHDMVFLGEKGQAKSRLMRSLTGLLDEAIPYVEGCEIHDDPLRPVCARCRRLVAERGDDLPIAWWPREERYGERLAPGTKIADLIGDLDPARVAGGTLMSSEEALHFGLLPRFHRGIFAINELPDMDYLIQVSLFNILEERDLQIRGYPLRFNLDLCLVFTANPDEYSRSGKIITQLKDRIGAEIRTHYPRSREVGIAIMEQEARLYQGDPELYVPDYMKKVLEQITIEARNSPYVNHRSGVSARLSISNYETLAANARRRALALGESRAVPRMSDLASLYTSTSGKIELDPFREETVTEFHVISRIFDKAVRAVFEEEFPDEDWSALVAQFKGDHTTVRVSDMMPSREYARLVERLPQLWEPVHLLRGHKSDELRASAIEFVLEGLHVTGRLSRTRAGELVEYLAGR
ncbi:MAG TPA: magnesium chelatase [Candidatus Nitrosotenuis sp.]|nr:magnesium chelatase [Candidatus Nitrosotenuis sp.]